MYFSPGMIFFKLLGMAASRSVWFGQGVEFVADVNFFMNHLVQTSDSKSASSLLEWNTVRRFLENCEGINLDYIFSFHCFITNLLDLVQKGK